MFYASASYNNSSINPLHRHHVAALLCDTMSLFVIKTCSPVQVRSGVFCSKPLLICLLEIE